jgi:hypothetical protein
VKMNKEQVESEKGKYLPEEVSDMTSNSWCHSIFTVAVGYESPQLSRQHFKYLSSSHAPAYGTGVEPHYYLITLVANTGR